MSKEIVITKNKALMLSFDFYRLFTEIRRAIYSFCAAFFLSARGYLCFAAERL
jgi:hypothetical protein